ncbi:hypothetical protein A9G09_11555 [Gilliamella sp. wkB292]|uniref:hypothetical protein n=1 Tax=Gilliamella sp. wkB292 TaxID=3120262 RepID=UPI00080E05C1|nr:hypothetical protein [Gilliamella apicola]OCG10929.1 hypothetical protein A9G09_11555 [Gilliamella apicola]
MTKIVELWHKQQLPIKDGIYFASGQSIALDAVFFPQLSIHVGEKFDLNVILNNDADNLTDIDIFDKIILANGDQCIIGEGSYGSEGFIAYLSANQDLIWVIYFEKSNPFIKVLPLTNQSIMVESSANFQLIIELANPVNLKLIK